LKATSLILSVAFSGRIYLGSNFLELPFLM
jgi:hypothetical protein